MEELIIGSHVSFTKNEGLLGSVNEALSYGENTFMFYTGAPQNTVRAKIDKKKTEEAKNLMKENNIDINNVIIHAPYIVNLANNKDEQKYIESPKFERAKEFWEQQFDNLEFSYLKDFQSSSYEAIRKSITLSKAETDTLVNFCNNHKTSLFSLNSFLYAIISLKFFINNILIAPFSVSLL